MKEAPPAVELRGLIRRFGSVTALDGARLVARSGEVHGILGENGAGKTTLLSILAGLLAPDAGQILLRGETASIPSPRAARAMGIGMVHQHFALVPRLTVLENLMLGWPGPGLGLPDRELRQRALALEDETGLHVPLEAPVETLGVGERQRVEILKVLLQEPEILILDEPTAVLSPPEVDGLLALVRSLAARGTCVLFVAHKLDEVLEAARDEVDAPALARAMVGPDAAAELLAEALPGEVAPPAVAGVDAGAAGPDATPHASPPVARLEDVWLSDGAGGWRLREVSLEVRRGEIVGIAGVEGNGQRQLARILAGEAAPTRGRVTLPEGPSFVPQDRRREGLVQTFTLTENMALRLLDRPAFRKGPLIRWGRLEAWTREALERFSVRSAGPGAPAWTLSGGNQQRVVLARELAEDPDFLVAENPTRGLDVAGEAFVHRTLRELRARDGRPGGVVLISTDLDEVVTLADRVMVMVRGRLVPVPPGPDLRERAGQLMLGAP